LADSIHNLGINTINSTNYAIIPNPTTGAIYVKGTSNVHIRVYNIIGQQMKEAKNTDNISLAELPNGMYLVRLFDDEDRFIYQDKILKE
jgi:peptidoglycan hydrolase-like amidase